MARKPPNLTEKLASVLLEYQRLIGDPLDREHMKQLDAQSIVSLFNFDHVVYHVWDPGNNHPTNLTPMLISDHRDKTAKRDVPAIAKVRRALTKGEEEMRRRLLATDADGPVKRALKRTYNWPSRKMQSRPFPKRKKA